MVPAVALYPFPCNDQRSCGTGPSAAGEARIDAVSIWQNAMAHFAQFEVVVHGPGGTVLGRQPMETVPGIAHNLPGKVTFFSAQVPASGAAAIEIFRDGKLVARRERSEHGPSVHDVDVHRRRYDEECGAQGSKPSGCAHEADDEDDVPVILVTWHTRYHGTAPLRAKVDFSADDGATWRPVFFGPDRGRVVLRQNTLIPSQTARIRVRLSDGFNEAEAVSPEFREPGSKPVLRIDSSRGVSEVRVGQTVYLSGSAYDAAHQRVPGEQMRWFIGDRFLGSGQSVALSSLPVGDAVIRLAVPAADRVVLL
jgi:hypothetical protein